MAIVINGSGTVTGLSVGGLPDGTVDADTLASGAGGVDGVSSSADATAMTITAAEKIGIGTGSPSVNVHIVDDASEGTPTFAGATHFAVQATASSSDNVNASLISGSAGTSRIMFGDKDDEDIGKIEYNNSTNAMSITTNTATAMTIDSAGAVTMPKQPAFLRTELTGDQSITSTAPVTVTFDTEKYDQNSDMTSTTFTAPVTGKYLFAMAITAESLNDDYIVMHLDTSNHNYAIHPLSTANNSATYKAMTGSLIVDMDANDTAIITANSANDSSYTLRASRTFCGALIC
jgi:hypothetical protein